MLKQLTMAILVILVSASEAATAGTIYKCTEGGRISYNDRPCGKSTAQVEVLAVQAAPAAPEVLERLARERALLQEIEEERALREEREARDGARAQRAADVQRRRCDKLRLQRKWADEDTARAGRDDAERARLKARRQAEVLAVECPA